MLRQHHFQALQRGKRLLRIAVNACADARSLGRPHGAVRVVQFDGGPGHAGQGLAEHLGLEHIGQARMNLIHFQAHLLHNLNAVLEGKDDAFLRRPHQMRLAVPVKIESVHAAPGLPVLQHALRSVAERQDAHALAADRDLGGQLVHLRVAEPRHYIAAHPGIEDARPVDAQQHAQSRIRGRMVHVRKGVHAGQRVILNLADNAVHHPRGTCCRSNFSRVEYVEAQRIIGLIPGAVGYRRSGCEPQRGGGRFRERSLNAEGGFYRCQDGIVKAKIVQ